MNLSIIVLTHNSSLYLKDCIDSIKKNLIKGDELIIIDNNSSDETREILKKSIDIADVYFSTKNLGIVEGRNLGLKLAKHEVLAFIDSDIILEDNALNCARKSFDKNEHAALVGLYNEVGDGYNWHVEMNRELFAGKRKKNFKKIITYKNYTTFSGGLCLIRKDVINKYYGYDHSFIGGPSEDIKLELLLIKDGYKIYYESKFFGKHMKKPLSFRGLMKRSWQSGKGVANLIKSSRKEKFRIPFNEQWPYLPIVIPLEILLFVFGFINNYFWLVMFSIMFIRIGSVIFKKCRNIIYKIRFLYIRIFVDIVMFISVIKHLFSNKEILIVNESYRLEKISE